MHGHYTKPYYNTLNRKINHSTDSELGGAIMIVLFFIILIPTAIIQSIYAPKRRNYKSIDDAKLARNGVNNIHNNAMCFTKIAMCIISIYLIWSFGFDMNKMEVPLIICCIGFLPFMIYTSFTKWRVNAYDEMIEQMKRF